MLNVIPLESDTDSQTARRVEHLLLSAADFDPPSQPPPGLETRALARWRAREAEEAKKNQAQWRLTIFGAFAAAAGAAWACAVVAVPTFRQMDTTPQPGTERYFQTAIRPASPDQFSGPGAKSTDVLTSPSRVARAESPAPIELPAPAPIVKPEPSVSLAASRPVARMPLARRSSARSAARLVSSQRPVRMPSWKVEQVVSEEVDGVLAPGWVVHRDEERGSLVVSPSLVDIPMQEDSNDPNSESSPGSGASADLSITRGE